MNDATFQRVILDRAGRADIFVGVGVRTDDSVHGPDHDHRTGCVAFNDVISKSPSEQKIAGGVSQVLTESLPGDIRQVERMALLSVVDKNVDLTG